MKLKIRDWSKTVYRPKETPQRVFIRFGLWDRNESLNHYTGEKERGLSVYPAVIKDGVVELDESEIVAEHPDLLNRFAFPVTGNVVGYGSDGEPVLKGVRLLPYALSTKTKQEGFRIGLRT